MGYEIVPYAPEFDAQIAEVQRHLWSRDLARNTAYLRWKYAENPFFDETLIRLVLSGGRVVAMRGMFGTRWQVDRAESCHLLPATDDLVVAPEHRNRGLASRVMKATTDDAARRGFPFVVSLSAGRITFVTSLATGSRSAGSFGPVELGQTPSPQLERVRMLAGRMPLLPRVHRALRSLYLGGPFRRLDREGNRYAGPVRLSGKPRPDAMAELVARLPWDGRIRHVRTAAYFDWRFRNPIHDYRFLFWDEDRLRGYLVLQRYLSDRSNSGRVNIADWEASDERVHAGLLEAALTWGRFRRVHAWTATASELTRSLLRARGFEPLQAEGVRSRSEGLLVRRLGEGPGTEPWVLGSRDVLKIENWDLRMLYSMAG